MSRTNQSLCVKKFPEDLRNLGKECYKDEKTKLWVRSKYDMNDVTDELSPLHIFYEPMNETDVNDYDDIDEGIHNFLLFWDDAAQKYTLVTAYFNAFEFGSKHNMLSLRTLDKTPDTFIISGEINKNGNNIHFHDTSSQYFWQECNIKRQAPIIYLYDLIHQMKIEIDEDGDIEIDDLDKLKTIIWHKNRFNAEFKVKLGEVQSLPELKALLLSSFPIGKIEESVIYTNYIILIKNILADAFQRIFKRPIQVEYVSKFEEAEYNYYGQKDVRKTTNMLCPNIPFDVYSKQVGCKEERKDDKQPFNSCNMPDDKPKSTSPIAKRQRKN